MFDSSIIHSTPIESQQQQQQVTPFNLRDEEIFKTDDDPSSLETFVRQVLNRRHGIHQRRVRALILHIDVTAFVVEQLLYTGR